jgi:hypothetical protein
MELTVMGNVGRNPLADKLIIQWFHLGFYYR